MQTYGRTANKRELICAYRKAGFSITETARAFGVSRATVCHVTSGDNWGNTGRRSRSRHRRGVLLQMPLPIYGGGCEG